MFCPVGYRSAAELWVEYRDQRLEAACRSALETYRSPKIVAGYIRGSPLDICEHMFLKSLSKVGVYLASPAGDVMRVHIEYEDGSPSLFGSLSPKESTQLVLSQPSGSNAVALEALQDNNSYQAWMPDSYAQSVWADEYESLESRISLENLKDNYFLHFRTLLLHIVRRAYTVSREQTSWTRPTAVSERVAPMLEHYAGWAICLDEATYQGEWQDYLRGKTAPYDHDIANITGRQAGRPGLDDARKAFEATGCVKGRLSWERIARNLEAQTGQKPSYKTLRTWQIAYEERDNP